MGCCALRRRCVPHLDATRSLTTLTRCIGGGGGLAATARRAVSILARRDGRCRAPRFGVERARDALSRFNTGVI